MKCRAAMLAALLTGTEQWLMMITMTTMMMMMLMITIMMMLTMISMIIMMNMMMMMRRIMMNVLTISNACGCSMRRSAEHYKAPICRTPYATCWRTAVRKLIK